MNMLALKPGDYFPNISVSQYQGTKLELAYPRKGFEWQLIAVYRGKHCPLCTRYLQSLNALVDEFHAIGIDVVAVSSDTLDKVETQLEDVKPKFNVGYGLNVNQMKTLGLLITEPRPDIGISSHFSEPALFVLNQEGKVIVVDISNVPFARPDLQTVLKGVTWLRSQPSSFPITGSY
ncbi:redoxin domain-containing protein [Vibrio vulnificus]|uniref:redoxin domain-containing protein n=1 Tax=Vibrio vulnificus TaxID=672 RepID=UPI0013EE61D7|nr:redoxin domain-containing protein [Vibrio vulnificus]EGQ7996631.1 redoxin domain-containing protein [Vibrio vulnificus]